MRGEIRFSLSEGAVRTARAMIEGSDLDLGPGAEPLNDDEVLLIVVVSVALASADRIPRMVGLSSPFESASIQVAVVRAVYQTLIEIGLIESDSTPEDVAVMVSNALAGWHEEQVLSGRDPDALLRKLRGEWRGG